MSVLDARRSRATEGAESPLGRLRLCREIFSKSGSNLLFRQKLLRSFTFRSKAYRWFIGTYHPYKHSDKMKFQRVCRLSFLTDKLRKYYHKESIIIVTKELSEDFIPHFHVLLGFKRIKSLATSCPPRYCELPFLKIRNMKEWSMEWAIGCEFMVNYKRVTDKHGVEGDVLTYDVSAFNPKIGDWRLVDMGAEQRWFRYGIHRYLLYMFKYSKFILYNDYYLFNIKKIKV